LSQLLSLETTTSRSTPGSRSTKLTELERVLGAKSACEADESDGEEGHDDGGEADVWGCADEGELCG